MLLSSRTINKKNPSQCPYYIFFDKKTEDKSFSPMTEETNGSSPDLVYSTCSRAVSDNTSSSIDTESVTASIDSTSLWNHLPVNKYIDEKDAKKKWKCLDCGDSFIDWNLTKTLHHVARKTSNDIKKCRKIITDEKLKKYEGFYHDYKKNQTVRREKIAYCILCKIKTSKML